MINTRRFRFSLLPGVATLCQFFAATAAASEVSRVESNATAIAIAALFSTILLALVYRRYLLRLRDREAARSRKKIIPDALRALRLKHIDNCVLPGTCNGLARIDHAVLTTVGIVCMRSKYATGKIIAEPRDPQWRIISGAQPQQFLNPVIQNDGRAAALRKALPDTPVFSLVVFTGTVRLPTKLADNVILVKQLEEWLANLTARHPSAPNLADAWSKLQYAALTDTATLRDFEAQLSFG